jgi:hypothetical protein
VVSCYTYEDQSGLPLFRVCRTEPKGFFQQRPLHNGEWANGLSGVPLVPYRLPEILVSEWILVVEGEKDVEALRGLGFTATCNPMGAGKWRKDYAPYFAGKGVTLLPDNDLPGLQHMVSVSRSLIPVAAAVHWLDMPRGKDAADWIAAGASEVEIAERLNGAVRLTK